MVVVGDNTLTLPHPTHSLCPTHPHHLTYPHTFPTHLHTPNPSPTCPHRQTLPSCYIPHNNSPVPAPPHTPPPPQLRALPAVRYFVATAVSHTPTRSVYLSHTTPRCIPLCLRYRHAAHTYTRRPTHGGFCHTTHTPMVGTDSFYAFPPTTVLPTPLSPYPLYLPPPHHHRPFYLPYPTQPSPTIVWVGDA